MKSERRVQQRCWERAGAGIRGRQESLAEIAGDLHSRHPAPGEYIRLRHRADRPARLTGQSLPSLHLGRA